MKTKKNATVRSLAAKLGRQRERYEILEGLIAKAESRLATLMGFKEIPSGGLFAGTLVDSIGKRIEDRTNQYSFLKGEISRLRDAIAPQEPQTDAEFLEALGKSVIRSAQAWGQLFRLLEQPPPPPGFYDEEGRVMDAVRAMIDALKHRTDSVNELTQRNQALRDGHENTVKLYGELGRALNGERDAHQTTKKSLAMALRQLSVAKADFQAAANAALWWSREAKGAMAVVAHDSVFNPRPAGYEGIESKVAPAAFVTDLWEWDGSDWKVRKQPTI